MPFAAMSVGNMEPDDTFSVIRVPDMPDEHPKSLSHLPFPALGCKRFMQSSLRQFPVRSVRVQLSRKCILTTFLRMGFQPPVRGADEYARNTVLTRTRMAELFELRIEKGEIVSVFADPERIFVSLIRAEECEKFDSGLANDINGGNPCR